MSDKCGATAMSRKNTTIQDTLPLPEMGMEPIPSPSQPSPKQSDTRAESPSVETAGGVSVDRKSGAGGSAPAEKGKEAPGPDGKAQAKQPGTPSPKRQHRIDGPKGSYKKRPKKPYPGPKMQRKKLPPRQAKKKKRPPRKKRKIVDSIVLPSLGKLMEDPVLRDVDELKARALEYSGGGQPVRLTEYYGMPLLELVAVVEGMGVRFTTAPNRRILLQKLIEVAAEQKRPILDHGLLWVTEDDGAWVVHEHNNYVPRAEDFFVPQVLIEKFGLQSGHMVEIQALPQPGDGCAYVADMTTASGLPLEEVQNLAPFEDLIPYYPTKRIFLETPARNFRNQDVSMRVIDALTPIGFGQRGLIVAAPRTGKTVLLQGIANSLEKNCPEAELIILLIDERPEEVTDFRRMVKGEVIASTFDEAADNHVHVAEMVIEKARRMVEVGKDVVILLDSITRLAGDTTPPCPTAERSFRAG